MKHHKFPSKLIDKFIGNPFDIGHDINYLHIDNLISYINYDIYIDIYIRKKKTKIRIR